jgi:hypothetical protein
LEFAFSLETFVVFLLSVSNLQFLVSVVGNTGGKLMEIYILQYGKGGDCIPLQKALEGTHDLTDYFKTNLIKTYTLPFWLHLAVTLHQLNQQVTGPLTLWMLLQEYRGLSRLGRAMANYVGLAPSLRNYDKVRSALLEDATLQIAEITSSGRCLVAFDNYTHQYGTPALTTDRKVPYFQARFTVGAVIEWPPEATTDINFIVLKDKTYLTSVPASVQDLKLFEDKVTFIFVEFFSHHLLFRW